MVARSFLAGLLLTVVASPAVAQTSRRPQPSSPAVKADVPVSVRLMDLAALRRLFSTVARQQAASVDGEQAADWTDFSLIASAVIGEAQVGPFSFEALVEAAIAGGGPHVQAKPGVAGRDAAAYQLLQLGYSARETADVVMGRISVRALDTARGMLAVGRSRESAADFLDGEYRRVMRAVEAQQRAARERRPRSTPFDALIERYARLHGVDTSIVRAIMETESAFNPLAVSRAGAIGLMQLMPMTAFELGVNPFVPEQNIEGGIRYFARMLKTFGSLEMALVAYNGGPGYATRFARGQAVLYGETRDYVRRVLGRLATAR